MTINLYAIKDKINEFLPIQMLPNDQTAHRWFREMLENNPTMHLSPNDFEIYKLGTWDTVTGELTSKVEIVPYNTKGDMEK